MVAVCCCHTEVCGWALAVSGFTRSLHHQERSSASAAFVAGRTVARVVAGESGKYDRLACAGAADLAQLPESESDFVGERLADVRGWAHPQPGLDRLDDFDVARSVLETIALVVIRDVNPKLFGAHAGHCQEGLNEGAVVPGLDANAQLLRHDS